MFHCPQERWLLDRLGADGRLGVGGSYATVALMWVRKRATDERARTALAGKMRAPLGGPRLGIKPWCVCVGVWV